MRRATFLSFPNAGAVLCSTVNTLGQHPVLSWRAAAPLPLGAAPAGRAGDLILGRALRLQAAQVSGVVLFIICARERGLRSLALARPELHSCRAAAMCVDQQSGIPGRECGALGRVLFVALSYAQLSASALGPST